MNKTIIKAKGSFMILNYIISLISIIFISLFFLNFVNVTTKNEFFLTLILGVFVMYENIVFIIRIKYLNNCKVIFENSQLTLVTLKPKIVPKNKLAIFRISSKNCKNKRILIPIKEEIYYDDILKYGYLKDLKIKIPYSDKKSLGIITKDNKYYLRENQFHKKQLNEIIKILDKKIDTNENLQTIK